MTSEQRIGGRGRSRVHGGHLDRGRWGFTLIELLVVILIIGILVALLVPALGAVRTKAFISATSTDINTFDQALRQYHLDYHIFPGYGADAVPETNAFPQLWEALMGEYKTGGGGKSSPYIDKIEQDDVVIYDAIESDIDDPIYRIADNVERYDPHTEKFFKDPWNNIFRYRESESKREKEGWMINRTSYDMWSYGPNGFEQSELNEFDLNTKLDAEGEHYDDVGNW